MLSLVLSLVALGADPSYNDAYLEATEKNVPMVILVGAEWCPHCRVMKSTLRQMAKDGELDGVAVGLVDYDKQTPLAKRLLTSTTVPELIVFRRRSDRQWERRSVTGDNGGQEPDEMVRRLIR